MNEMAPKATAKQVAPQDIASQDPLVPAPLGLLAELTHRCPLRCPYCSNPVELARASAELDAATWGRVFAEAAEMGVLQLHLSGGEPAVRRDLAEIVRLASQAGLYSNLITSGVLTDARRLSELVAAGLDHVQLSVQDALPDNADRIAGFAAHAKKMEFARLVRAEGLPLTLNAVVHRQNLDRLPQLIELALALGCRRMEVAHVQYHGWALINRAALLPSRAQLDAATETVERARAELRGRLVIDYVVPDYYAERPKACMGGWGRQIIVVAPDGRALPCHAATGLPGFDFPNVRETSLREIWESSDAFSRFRGTGWMPTPCRGCPHAEEDWGGCRCQAFALTGDAAATDPACALSPRHHLLDLAVQEAAADDGHFTYREMGGARRAEGAPATPAPTG